MNVFLTLLFGNFLEASEDKRKKALDRSPQYLVFFVNWSDVFPVLITSFCFRSCMAEPGMTLHICILHMAVSLLLHSILHYQLSGGQPGSEVPFPVTFFLVASSSASNFRFHSTRYFRMLSTKFSLIQLLFPTLQVFLSCFYFFPVFSVIDEAPFSSYLIFNVCLFKSFCFWEAYFKEAAFSTDGQLSSTPPMEITKFDEGDCRVVSFETKEVAVEAEEAQLLEVVDEPAGPIKETKK